MFKQRKGDVLFIIAILSLSVILILSFGAQGLTLTVWMVLFPLYIFRLIIWSKWEFWKETLYHYLTPFKWKLSVFTLWPLLALFVFFNRHYFYIHAFEIPLVLKVIGLLLSLAGLFITFWTLWLLGIDRAVLTTLIFGENKKEQGKIIFHGPYALNPHPMFMGEKIIVSGAFIFTGELSLVILFILALIANTITAREEEKDLLKKQGKNYKAYKSKTPFLFYSKKTGSKK